MNQPRRSTKRPAGQRRARRSKGNGASFADLVIESLEEFVEAAKSGEDLHRRFSVQHVPQTPPPRRFRPSDIRGVRDRVGVSQAVFAAILGVSTKTLQAWEQGVGRPPGVARRLLETIARDPDPWRRFALTGKAA